MLARVRIDVPDRPGTLGQVASAIGTVGADIVKVDVLDSEAGRAVDDVFVLVRDEEHLTRVEASLGATLGVTLLGTQHPAPPTAGHAELQLLGQVLAQPDRALATLVDGAPAAMGADWGAAVRFDGMGHVEDVVAVSAECPGPDHVTLRSPLRLASVRMTPPGEDTPYGGTAVVPLGTRPLALVLVRAGGPAFHRTELWRFGQLGTIVGAALRDVG